MTPHSSSSGDATPPSKSGRSRRPVVLGGLAVAVILVGLVFWRHVEAEPEVAVHAPPAVPVTVAAVNRSNVPVYLEGLGTIQASQTVTIRPQVDGPLVSVNFIQGQEVHKGDVLARIDSRALQATLDEAVAKKSEDTAQLDAAQKDLTRFKSLAQRSFETQQNVDQQQAKVDQFNATIQADQAAIESAQTQLSYATIVAPFDGRVGIRQVDAGNIVHANDPNPITVLTQIRPSYATFSLPQKNLADIRDALVRGTVPVEALDQNNTRVISHGQLLLVDNQIDQSTGTIKLRATFDNTDERLWPGESVHVRVLAATRDNAITMPTAALQQGPDGTFVWVIKPDNTAEQRSITPDVSVDDVTAVTKGLAPGEKVVVDGQYRLEKGIRVSVRESGATQHAADAGAAAETTAQAEK